jgi:hypothetical protein
MLHHDILHPRCAHVERLKRVCCLLASLSDISDIQAKQQLFSERTLAQYDGSDPNKPLYIAVSLSFWCFISCFSPFCSPSLPLFFFFAQIFSRMKILHARHDFTREPHNRFLKISHFAHPRAHEIHDSCHRFGSVPLAGTLGGASQLSSDARGLILSPYF